MGKKLTMLGQLTEGFEDNIPSDTGIVNRAIARVAQSQPAVGIKNKISVP
jgi:hypothetical protein